MSDRDAYEILEVTPRANQLVIQAAYRVLAALYHPDRGESLASSRRMAELNDAYAKLRTPKGRAAYDAQRKQRAAPSSVITPVAPRAQPAKAAKPREKVIDFGRYEGWTIKNVAGQDPDYLRWLIRHSSGMRFRSEIEAALASTPTGPSTTDRVFRRR